MPHYKFDQIAFNITDKKMPEPGDEKMYIGLEHLDSGSLKITRWGSEVELTGQKLVMRKGDVLFGRRNTYLRRAAIAPHDGIFSAHGMIFRPKTQVIDPEYFPFFISSNYFMDAAIRISVGSLSPTVNWKTLKELEFDLPSLEEQRKNAALLKSINETKEAYQELLIQTDNLVKSQFIEMFDTVTDAKPLADLAEMVTVGIANSATHAYVDDGVLMFRNQNIKANELDDSDLIYIKPEFAKKYESKTLKANDILVARTGYPGTACIVPEKYAGSQTFTTLIVRMKQSSGLLPAFVCRYINSPSGQTYVKENEAGSAQLNFGATALSKMPIILPPMELQERYLVFAEQSDKSKFELKEAIKSCDALMKAILFTNLEEKEG